MGAREFEVALVVRRHSHDGAGPVFHEHEARDVDRKARAGQRVATEGAGRDSFLADCPLGSAARSHARDERCDARLVRRARCEGAGERVLGSEAHERHAEQGVGPRGEDRDLAVAPLEREPDLRPLAPSDPVALHRDDPLGPAGQPVEVP